MVTEGCFCAFDPRFLMQERVVLVFQGMEVYDCSYIVIYYGPQQQFEPLHWGNATTLHSHCLPGLSCDAYISGQYFNGRKSENLAIEQKWHLKTLGTWNKNKKLKALLLSKDKIFYWFETWEQDQYILTTLPWSPNTEYKCCGSREGRARRSVFDYIKRCWITVMPILGWSKAEAASHACSRSL